MHKIVNDFYVSVAMLNFMANKDYMHFVTSDPRTVRKYHNIVLPEFTDLGWAYQSIANVFEDKLCSAEKIALGYCMYQDPAKLFEIPMKQRDKIQLINAIKTVQQYAEFGQTNIMMPTDMATSALILMSAMYRCTTTMDIVGLSSEAKTIEEHILTPIRDSYTELYSKSIELLPHSQRAKVPASVDRKFFKGVCMENYYGGTASIKKLPENLQETFHKAKGILIPAQLAHHKWGMQAGAVLTDRGATEVKWTSKMSGRQEGYTCLEKEHATAHVPGGASFDVSQTVRGNPHHLPIIANSVHWGDSEVLVPLYQQAKEIDFNTFTTHDAANSLPTRKNQERQVLAEAIIDIAVIHPFQDMVDQLELPQPEIQPLQPWIEKLNMHNMMA